MRFWNTTMVTLNLFWNSAKLFWNKKHSFSSAHDHSSQLIDTRAVIVNYWLMIDWLTLKIHMQFIHENTSLPCCNLSSKRSLRHWPTIFLDCPAIGSFSRLSGFSQTCSTVPPFEMTLPQAFSLSLFLVLSIGNKLFLPNPLSSSCNWWKITVLIKNLKKELCWEH